MIRQFNNFHAFGDPLDQGAIDQMERCLSSGHATHGGVLCADAHKGYAVPIGGVIAYHDQISPSGVGYDISCGCKAVLTDATASDVRRKIPTIMDDIVRNISFGVGRKNNTPVSHPLFEDDLWKEPFLSNLKQMAEAQLGTVGSGNHYVDIFEDEQERIWVGCHFGSRGLGHKIATEVLRKNGASDGMDVAPLVLNVHTYEGEAYLQHMELAGRYAYAGRDWVCGEVCRILGARQIEEIHNHHNFAWKEKHFGIDLWVIRKGATPAFPGQKGFVGSSMGEHSVIIEGKESTPEAEAAYFSTVHGAGRVMSRTAATGKIHRKTGRIISQGIVSDAMMKEWLEGAHVELRGGGLDESPHCYKRLDEVLTHHASTIRILHRLKPLGVAMAGKDIADPFRD